MDMLIRLYDLPAAQAVPDIVVRRAMAFEASQICDWVSRTFRSQGWVDETRTALAHTPANCFVAMSDGALCGFCCYDTTCLGFVGPVGIAADRRGQGIGQAVLLTALNAMRSAGYGYAVAGMVGAPEFFAQTARATPIDGSDPGVYGQT